MSKQNQKKGTTKERKAEKRAYEAPAFISSLAFERNSLACVPATRDANPGFPNFCSMQS